MDNTMLYGIQLAMLNRLLGEKLISEKEYAIIKEYLMRKYRIKQIAA